MWFMNGSSVSSTASVGNIPTNRTVVGVSDFNGDGLRDLLWRDSSGDIAVPRPPVGRHPLLAFPGIATPRESVALPPTR
jgi:hypothetical protein